MKPSPKLKLPTVQPIRKTGGRPAVGATTAIKQADALPVAKKPASNFKPTR